MITAHLKQGECIGQYQLERRLGAGGMAEVFLARRVGPHGFSKRVAIKRILPEYAKDPRLLEMFCDEAKLAAVLSHPNIVQVLDFGEHEGELFIVMELVDGVSCLTLLKAVAAKSSAFPLSAALKIAREVLAALAFAHEACDEDGNHLSIVHRDVSPSNILISRTGDVKLIDFGITCSKLGDRRTVPGELKGKLRYMSPEQVIGGELDGRSDLFAVGIVLAEMLSGRSLFRGKSDLDVVTRLYRGDLGALDSVSLPGEVRALVARALAHRPRERFQSAREFIEAIGAVARSAGVELDDSALVPWLHEMGVLSGSSGTRARAEQPRRPAIQRSDRPTLPSRNDGVVATERQGPRARIVSSAAAGRRAPSAARLTAPRVPMRTAPVAADQARKVSRSHTRLRTAERDSVTPTALSLAAPALSRTALPPPPPLPETGTYRIKSQLGTVVGPVKRSDLLEMLATGRVAADSQVSVDGVHFVEAREVPALSDMAARSAYQFRDRAPAQPDWASPLWRTTLPHALFSMAIQRRSGLLIVRDGQRQKRIYLEHGDPVFIASTQREELLGQRLVRSGLVDSSVVELALRNQPPMKLGEALVTLQAIKPPYLLRELVLQLEERFAELLSWSDGWLAFYAGATHDETPLRTERPTLELITRSVRMSFAPSEIASLLAPIAKSPVTRGPRYRAVATLLGLKATEFAALEQATTAPSVQQLTHDLPRQRIASMSDTLRAIFVGLSAGLLRAEGWPKACIPRPAAPRPA